MMDFNMFQEVVKDNILHSLPSEYKEASVSVHAVPKVNRTLHALTVMLPDHNKAPNIYLEEMYEHYQQNEDIQTTLAEVADAVVEATKEMSKVNPVLDADKIQDNVVLCLVNSKQNEELLKEVPNRSFQDLSVIYRWVVNMDRDGMQSMIITNDFAAARGFTEEELFQHAVENTKRICPPRVKSMQEVMTDMIGEDGMPQELLESMGVFDEIPPEKNLWVITNEMGINGAASMLYEENLHKLAEQIGTDLYLLPSSIHETIAVSVEMGAPEYLAQMVHDVNMTAVTLDERLSNNVYHYDKDLRKLELATDVPEKGLDSVIAEPPMIYEKEGPARSEADDVRSEWIQCRGIKETVTESAGRYGGDGRVSERRGDRG